VIERQDVQGAPAESRESRVCRNRDPFGGAELRFFFVLRGNPSSHEVPLAATMARFPQLRHPQ
jgi:hypothetical protein